MMPPPLHVRAREYFNARIKDHIEASIAFSLFLVSEQEWAAKWERERGSGPTDDQYRTFHENYLTPHEIERYHQTAKQLLAEYGTKLLSLFARVQHGHFRWWGIGEAAFGALLWTLFLILMSFILAYSGIDIVDIFKRVSGK
jgi:hypothetical protein